MKNCEVSGPSILVSKTFSILVCPGWKAQVLNEDVLLVQESSVKLEALSSHDHCDPIKLSLYSSRFMSIAEEMGKALQKTSISTNIK
jgi:5-oxoprolinase (ATP-hydrolysing)